MRIAIDLQGIQSDGSRKRGIGRYSIELLKSILAHFREHEYILCANASLTDLTSLFWEELKLSNVHYFEWFAPAPFDYFSKNSSYQKLATYLRTYSFSCLHADIILITSFFEGFSDNCLHDFDLDLISTPTVSIFYDLIPLLNHKTYLNNNPEFEKYYNLKLNKLVQLDGLLTISQSAAKEIETNLDYDKAKIYNISSACNRNIFNTNTIKKPSIEIQDLSPYLLYIGAGDPRKNLRGLLHAYSLLSIELKEYKLVLAGKLLQPEVNQIDEWIRIFSINPIKVIKTGFVSDEQLAELYKNCSLFIFPSFHEGFGLPVLEAMSCGAPVIASNRTSIPEVICNERAMFDPSKPLEMKNLIEQSLLDNDFSEVLKKNAQVQSNKFSWENCAHLAIDACEKIIAKNPKRCQVSNWEKIKIHNKDLFDLLFKKVQSEKSICKELNNNLLVQFCASLDRINIQIDKFSKIFTNNEGISSWRVEGPFDSSYSLAILNRYFTDALSKKIDNLSLHITEGHGDYEVNYNFLKSYTNIYNIYEQSLNNNSHFNVLSRNLYPPRVHDMNAKYNLLHSYGWEESEFPRIWVEEFNTYLDGITVMSNQVKKILIDNGVKIPIDVSGLGVDHFLKIKACKEFNLEAKSFRFLHISSCFPRKGIDILLKAFSELFTNEDDVSLIIKTFNNPHNNISNLLTELRTHNTSFPDVILILEELNNSQLKSLYLQSNALLAPSFGEGFGLPIGEAMLLGLPVITTNWGGQIDFCNNDNSWLVDYKFSPSKSHFQLDNSYWAEPLLSDLIVQMNNVFNASKDQLKEKLDRARSGISNFTWNITTNKNISFVNSLMLNTNILKPKVGIVTTWNSRCGIASYSKNLLDYFPKGFFVFSPFNDENDLADDYLVPSWRLDGNDQNLDLLKSEIMTRNISTLIIQFNYGFFDFNIFSQFLTTLTANNINILILFHSTNDPVNDDSKSLSSLSNILNKCTRLIVHTIEDLNRLKKIGLIDNVTLFPHPIIDFDVKTNSTPSQNIIKKIFNNKRKNVATFGFCLPNKGFKNLIKAMRLLKNDNINIYLNMYTSIYSREYDYLRNEYLDLINELKLQDIINIDFNYYSDQSLLELLSLNDLITFPYEDSGESSSASIRYALSTLKPVLATPSSIFTDVSEIVKFTNGFSSQDIALGIKSFFESDADDGFINRKNIIDNRRFSVLSKRFYSLIESLEIN